ncbi:MAG: tRNA (adenosine(37)-N6)-dimethylallyltransferase MiaA [Cyanomargarita calcarea GSE-NOS-MK-12-04C]|jgi:tRNA dimethylallyltransferase|uniref:tRNA dimethylallyltransferase n=1 Tax=Cyanomargarita calcarea GSE-NOS-MK-12-04C TaxID=2839659 RepID=A0A951QNS1_9CYAN|nr:tRNA (adenosine(37)-N6)-dimethylallyltransferase MiaA [Cyanomargarita calcarea GSE-NOS-MK-12-04C]
MTRLIVICGATATGKSGLALKLAMRLGSAILSADSRQVYREFDIGTAKPTDTEQKLAPHYLIDICAPTDIMTLADYQEQAQALITSLSSPSPELPLLLVGGTGLYIRSVTRGLIIPRVAPNYELRDQLQSLGQMQLYAMLQQVDLVASAKIHSNDSVRTLRALEVFYVTGRPISEQQGENPPDYPILQIGLDCDAPKLDLRIAKRTEEMIKDGLICEVEYLCEKYGADLPLLNTLGYQEIKQYLGGDISLDEAKELTVLHTRQFAKRQRTWFRADSQIQWFDAESSDLIDRVWECVEVFLTKN